MDIPTNANVDVFNDMLKCVEENPTSNLIERIQMISTNMGWNKRATIHSYDD